MKITIAIVALVVGYHIGASVGREDRREETVRAIAEADRSHTMLGQCIAEGQRVKNGLGVLWPSVGGIGDGP